MKMQKDGSNRMTCNKAEMEGLLYNTPYKRLIPDAFWEWNIETGQIFRNQALQNLIGFSPDKTQDLSWWLHRIAPQDRTRVQKSIDKIISKKGNTWSQDYRFKCADGTYKKVSDKGYIQYNGDRPMRMIGFLQNTVEMAALECLLQQEKAQQELKIAQSIVQAQEQERTYIGLELHDNVCQLLTSARLYLNLLKPASNKEKALRSKTSDLILSAIKEIRCLSQNLAVTPLKSEGLICSIKKNLKDLQNTGLFNVKFTSSIANDLEYSLHENKKVALFRIVQQQLNNIIKHSQAKNITVNLTQTKENFVVYVSDDGKGFELQNAKNGMGLSNIYSRTKSLNGQVDIVTAPGKGCTLTLIVPFD